jgi:hypothetical protein
MATAVSTSTVFSSLRTTPSMRLALALVIATAIVTATVLVASRDDEQTTDLGAATLVGDSMNVGTDPYLREALSGWRIDAHDRVGRTTAEGVEQLRALGGAVAPVVVVSLGTNDADGSEDEFRALVGDVLRLAGPGRCVVWATIVRGGAPRAGFNDVLEEAAAAHRQLRLLDWAMLVEHDESLLAGDLVHGTPDGYVRRAEETARIARTCPG